MHEKCYQRCERGVKMTMKGCNNSFSVPFYKRNWFRAEKCVNSDSERQERQKGKEVLLLLASGCMLLINSAAKAQKDVLSVFPLTHTHKTSHSFVSCAAVRTRNSIRAAQNVRAVKAEESVCVPRHSHPHTRAPYLLVSCLTLISCAYLHGFVDKNARNGVD
jgi:hypothetical protein